MQPIIFTKDIDNLFFPRLEEVCEDLSTEDGTCRAIDLLRVMKSESDVRADAWNNNPKNLPPEQRYNASGIIQFMPATLLREGWTHGHADFRKLTPTEQLPWVRRYFAAYRGKLINSAAVYTATFLPALIDHAGDPDFVLTAKDGPLGWAYQPNASFDANHDLAITVRELDEAIDRNCRGPRWGELVARLGDDANPPTPTDFDLDLGTVAGLQEALRRLGFDPGPIDGRPGPRTHDALAAFQKQDGGLVVDGVYGPASRSAIEIALTTRA